MDGKTAAAAAAGVVAMTAWVGLRPASGALSTGQDVPLAELITIGAGVGVVKAVAPATPPLPTAICAVVGYCIAEFGTTNAVFGGGSGNAGTAVPAPVAPASPPVTVTPRKSTIRTQLPQTPDQIKNQSPAELKSFFLRELHEGKEAQRLGNWDSAVEHYANAVLVYGNRAALLQSFHKLLPAEHWDKLCAVLKEDIDEIQLATDPDPDNNNNNSSNSSSSSSSNDPVGARSQAPSVGAMAIACVGAGIVLTLAVLQNLAKSSK